jgi:hypothetical protein
MTITRRMEALQSEIDQLKSQLSRLQDYEYANILDTAPVCSDTYEQTMTMLLTQRSKL